MNKKIYADRLSDLVLRIGVNLQKGEFLNIVVSPDAYFYAQNMAIKAYEMGALASFLSGAGPTIMTLAREDDSEYVDKIKQELMEYELVPEEWGGDTIFVPISAKQKLI